MQAMIYTRVSSQDQSRGWSLETQEAACCKYAEAHDLEVVAIYSDTETGATAERIGYQAMIAAFRRGEASALIVYQTDRLHRNLPNAMLARAELQRLGVDIHTVRRGRAGTTAEEQFVNNIDDLVSELERARIQERTMRGRRAKAESGLFGQGPAPYGYRYAGRGRERVLEIDEPTAAIVRLIFQWYAIEELGAREIAKRLTADGVRSPGRGNATQEFIVARDGWSDQSVYTVLRRRAYSGTMELYTTRRAEGKKRLVRPKSERILAPVPAIIDLETWARAEQRLATGRQHSTGRRIHDYLLARHIRCACGYGVSGRASGRADEQRRLWYVCNGRVTRLTARPCTLPLPWLPAPRVDAAVWSWFVGQIGDRETLERLFLEYRRFDAQTAQATTTTLEDQAARRAKLERSKARLLDLYEAEEIDRQEWRKRSTAIDAELASLQAPSPPPPSAPPIPLDVERRLLDFADRARPRLAALDFDARRTLLHLFSIVVTLNVAGDEITARIDWKLGTATISI